MSNPIAAMAAIEMYDQVGGRPENINDYELGCVIAGASPLVLAVPSEPAAVDEYIAGCTASTGDARFCTCDASRKTSRVSGMEFEAYYRSFSDYSDSDATTTNEMTEARAKKMGVSSAQFDSLQSSARNKISAHQAEDEAYCTVFHYLLWERLSSLGLSIDET